MKAEKPISPKIAKKVRTFTFLITVVAYFLLMFTSALVLLETDKSMQAIAYMILYGIAVLIFSEIIQFQKRGKYVS